MPTSKSAETKTARIAKTEERSAKLKTSPEVVSPAGDVRSEANTPEVTVNDLAVAPAKPEVTSLDNPTTSSDLATTTTGGVGSQIKPLFYAEQPKDRAVEALPQVDYEALKANIKELGRILVPITIARSGIVIDGYARLQIAAELDFYCPWVVEDVGDDQIRSLARTLNLARRQLSAEQKRQLIAAELVEDAEEAKLGEGRRSFNMIAKKLGVACNTVISVSLDLIQSGKIPPITEAIGADGKLRKAPRPREPKPEVITGTSPAKAPGAAAPSITAPAATSPAATASGPAPARAATITEPDIAPTVTGPEPREQYLPEEHPLTEAVRGYFRAHVPVEARDAVDRLLASDPFDVPMGVVDDVIRRCGLVVEIVCREAQEPLATASA